MMLAEGEFGCAVAKANVKYLRWHALGVASFLLLRRISKNGLSEIVILFIFSFCLMLYCLLSMTDNGWQ